MTSLAENPFRLALLSLLPLAEYRVDELREVADAAENAAFLNSDKQGYLDANAEAQAAYSRAVADLYQAKRLLGLS